MSALDKVLRLTPRTPVASTVHEPVGPGPLWHHKGLQLPAYIQHVANDLREKGHDESKAIAMAVGIVRDWAAGRVPNGKGHVHPDVRAAASKAMAEWEKVKAQAHAETAAKDREHVKASLVTPHKDSAQVFPGQERIALPPVPGAKVARSMYTAHRIDDTLRHLAHAAERLATAKQGKALRGYHMIHVNNHLSAALDTCHNLVDGVRKNYLPEARELAALNKTMGLAASVSTDAKVATFAHLLQTLLYHLAHAKRHAALMLDPDPDPVWRFNYDHAAKHTEGAQEHCFKLARHIQDNYPDEARWMKELEKAEDPDTDFTGLVALASPVATAPGAAPLRAGPYQVPSQTVSPSPPLPPLVELPRPAEIRKLIAKVPECSDASLSASARIHLETAAVKLEKDDTLGALHVLRSAQSDIYACHKADLGMAMPAVYTANVFTRVPSAEQSSANTAMLRSKDREMAWRALEQQVAYAVDRIRRRHFHGLYPAGMQQARFSGESAVDRLLRLVH